MRSPLLLTGALASLAAAGCSASTSSDLPDAEAASTNATALVVVERSSGPTETSRPDVVIARFVRVREGKVDDQALRLAGAMVDLPQMGTCAVTPEAKPALQPRTVDLLDVGPLTVAGTVITPRAMPDPTGVVNGSFYSARSAEAFTPLERLQLRANGGPDMPEGFSVNVVSPRDLTDVHAATSVNALEVSWEVAEATPPDSRDLVYVDVMGTGSRLLARCTTTDTGHLSIADKTLGASALEEGQVAVHRVHFESFKAKGIEPGEIRFDIARIVAFRR
jgi:hypothetical protein